MSTISAVMMQQLSAVTKIMSAFLIITVELGKLGSLYSILIPIKKANTVDLKDVINEEHEEDEEDEEWDNMEQPSCAYNPCDVFFILPKIVQSVRNPANAKPKMNPKVIPVWLNPSQKTAIVWPVLAEKKHINSSPSADKNILSNWFDLKAIVDVNRLIATISDSM